MIKQIKTALGRKLQADDRVNLRNSLINAGGHLVTILSLLITTPLLLKQLGKDGTGVVMLAKSVLGVGGVMSLGMGQATLKFVSKYRALQDLPRVFAVINTTLTYYSLIGMTASLAVYLGAEWLATEIFKIQPGNEAEAILAFQLTAVGLAFTLIADALGSALKGFERFDLAVTSDVTMQVLLLTGQITLLLMGYGIVGIVMVIVASRLLNVALRAWMLCRRAAPGLTLQPLFDRKVIRESIGFGAYTWIGELLNKMRTEGPPFVLGATIGTEAVAIYNIAVRVLNQFVSLLSKAGSYLFPYISRVYEQGDHESVRRHYHHVTSIMVVLAAAGTTPIFVCAAPLLHRWLGAGISSEVMVILQILALRYAVLPLGIVNYSFVVATNRVRALVGVQLLGTLMMISGTVIGASWNGLEGAAWGQLSVFVTIIANRLYIEKSLFREISPLLHIAIVFAVGLPLACGYPFTLEPDVVWWRCACGLVIWTIVGGALAWGVMALGATPGRSKRAREIAVSS